MSQLGFEVESRCRAGNNFNTDVGCSVLLNARPSLVKLESGIQALVEITGFTYVDGVPVAIGGGAAKDINAADWVERCADGVKLKINP